MLQTKQRFMFKRESLRNLYINFHNEIKHVYVQKRLKNILSYKMEISFNLIGIGTNLSITQLYIAIVYALIIFFLSFIYTCTMYATSLKALIKIQQYWMKQKSCSTCNKLYVQLGYLYYTQQQKKEEKISYNPILAGPITTSLKSSTQLI